MSYTRDILGDYRLTTTVTEEEILRAAEEILTRRYERQGGVMNDPSKAGAFLKMRLAHQRREIFTVVFLDNQHRILAIEDLFHGTIDGAEVHPRVVAQRALEHNAAAILLAHNHPSGNTEPSAADRAVTLRLKQALDLFDIRLLDHFIIAGASAPISLAARGWV